MLTLITAMDITAIPTDTADTTAIPTVISAKDLLMLNLRLRLMLGEDIMADTDTDTAVPTDTDTADTDMVDTVDTIMVELLKTPLKLPSGSSHSNSFNLATIPSIF